MYSAAAGANTPFPSAGTIITNRSVFAVGLYSKKKKAVEISIAFFG
jgi:hypothetical protein